MILRRLRVQRFLGFHDASFEFARGINVVMGPNEAGKSTLRAAIRTALYGNPVTTSLTKREAFTSWGVEDPPLLELDFALGERIFRLTKDYARRAVIIADEAGRTWERHKDVQERLGVAVGLATEELFVATAQVAQAELERIHIESVAKGLGRLLSGVGEDVTVAIRRLDQRVAAMERGSKGYMAIRNPGVLRSGHDRVTALREQFSRLRASTAEIERNQLAQAKAARTSKCLGEDLAAKNKLLELNRRILQEEERLRGLAREEKMLEEQIKNIHENLHKLDTIDQALEQATAAGVPDEASVQVLRALQSRIAGQEDQIERLCRTLQEPAPEPSAGIRWRGLALAAIGGLGALLGMVLTLLGPSEQGVALLIAGTVAGLYGWWHFLRLAELKRQFVFRRADRQAQLESIQREVTETKAALSAHVVQCGAASAQDLENRFANYRGLVRDRKHVAQFLGELRGGSSDEELTEHWKTIRRDIFALEEQLRSPEIADKRLTALQVSALEQEVRRLSQEVPRFEAEERRLSWELERLAADTEALPAVEEQLQEAEDALAAARMRHAVYRAALEGLEKAKQQAEVPARTVMESRASEYLRLLSDGRYARLKVGEESLKIEVHSEDAGEWVDAEEPSLSRGTVDLVYLSARLALVHVLAGTKHPPLLFDDPFVTLDERRRTAVADLLRTLSETYQIFLFTCSPEYSRCADVVITLDGPVHQPTVETSDRIAVPSVGPLWDRLS